MPTTHTPSIGAHHRRRKHILSDVRVVAVRPRYPENLGAIARAMRVTGLSRLLIVTPERLARADHPHARRMAVGAETILDAATVVESVHEAIEGCVIAVGMSARSGMSRALTPRALGPALALPIGRSHEVALVFGGERTGLSRGELAACDLHVRIPMVASEPSLNLAQAVMIVLYELMVFALDSPEPADP